MTNIFWEMSEPVWGRKKDFGKLQKKPGLKHDKQKGIKQNKKMYKTTSRNMP